MKKYPSIEQFRSVIRAVKTQHDYQGKDENGDAVYAHLSPFPKLKFKGTVKLHGCFPSNAKVKMYDGSEKIISKVKSGDIILGYNNIGELVPSKVLNTMINGKTEMWYKILIKTNQMGGVRSVVCTENHEIYTINRGYVPAKDLTLNDTPLFSKESLNMAEKVIDMLNGKLLGDAYIHKQYGNLGITFGHKEEHENYINHCLEFLSFWGNPKKRKRISGYGTKMIDVSTVHNIAMEYYFKCWLNNEGKKTVPSLKLSKYTMAYWYMDDGSLSHTNKQRDRANFAICGFDDDEANKLLISLKEYGFKNPVLHKTEGYNRIRLNKDDAEKLFSDIRELVPEVMQYKLPEYHRGFFKGVEKDSKINKFYDLPTSIKKISTISSKKYSYSTKHDIETETHNYFVNSILVHNSNASIVKYSDGRLEYQSRERVLSLEQDNANFMMSMSNLNWHKLLRRFNFTDYIAVYGEWCGGNIQKGVAINDLPKMFIIFGIKIDNVWIDLPKDFHSNQENIYNILQFPTYNVEIDFNNPEIIQNKLIEDTLAVENECPVGKYFGVSGIGEGIVYKCTTQPDLIFKSKGEKHSVSKVKTLNAVDVESIEEIKDFVDSVVTENRLEQGLGYLNEMKIEIIPKNTGEFLRWIVTDVLKEETDTIITNQFHMKKVKNSIVSKARVWFLNKI